MKVQNSGIYFAAVAVGALSGLICVAFRYIVAAIASLRPLLFNHSNPIIAHIGVFSIIFIMLWVTGWLVKRFPKISGSGLPQTKALLFGRRIYNKPFTYLVIKFIGGVFSLCSGLSLGREGTSVQMGSLTGYIAGNMMKVPEGKKRHLIAAGAGAGVSAAFTAPLSSSILIMESLQKVTITTTLICTLLAGGTAGIIAKLITPYNIYDKISVEIPQNPQWQLILIFVIMSLFFAIAGKLFSKMLIYGKALYADIEKKHKNHPMIWLIKQGAFLAAITWVTGLFFTGMIGGDQTFLVKESIINSYLHPGIAGHPVLTFILNLLILTAIIAIISAFTIISHSSGYPGGIFLPMMTIGGLLGKLFYDILYLATGTLLAKELSGYFIFIGMSAFFIAVVRTPITGFILISEMTGHYETFFATLVVGILVYYLTQAIKVAPLNDLLYEFMIKQDSMQPQRTTIYIDIEHGCYLHNKRCGDLILPDGCKIAHIIRPEKDENGKHTNREIPIGPDLVIQENDSIGIEVNSAEIEHLYRALASFGE